MRDMSLRNDQNNKMSENMAQDLPALSSLSEEFNQ